MNFFQLSNLNSENNPKEENIESLDSKFEILEKKVQEISIWSKLQITNFQKLIKETEDLEKDINQLIQEFQL